MGHQHRRRPHRTEQVAHLLAQVHAQGGVEGGERLVEQDHGRRGRQGAGQGDALLLAAGELVGPAAAVPGQAHQRQHLLDAIAAAAPCGGGESQPARQPVGDVLRHGEVREEGALLGDDADIALLGAHERAGAGHQPLPQVDGARVGAVEAGEDAQQRRLAAARRAEHRGDPALVHVQIDSPQRAHGFGARRELPGHSTNTKHEVRLHTLDVARGRR